MRGLFSNGSNSPPASCKGSLLCGVRCGVPSELRAKQTVQGAAQHRRFHQLPQLRNARQHVVARPRRLVLHAVVQFVRHRGVEIRRQGGIQHEGETRNAALGRPSAERVAARSCDFASARVLRRTELEAEPRFHAADAPVRQRRQADDAPRPPRHRAKRAAKSPDRLSRHRLPTVPVSLFRVLRAHIVAPRLAIPSTFALSALIDDQAYSDT